MKPAWILHELNSEILLEHEISMKSTWIQHDFGMISTPIWFQFLYQAIFVMINSKLWIHKKDQHHTFFRFKVMTRWTEKTEKIIQRECPAPNSRPTNPNSQWYVSWKRIIPFVGVCWTDRGWEILVDGKSCPGGQMLQDYYSPGWNNPHSTMAERRGFGRHSHRRSVGVPL